MATKSTSARSHHRIVRGSLYTSEAGSNYLSAKRFAEQENQVFQSHVQDKQPRLSRHQQADGRSAKPRLDMRGA